MTNFNSLRPFYIVFLVASQLVLIQAQNCSLISLEDVNRLLPELYPMASSDGGPLSFSVMEFNVTCLAAAIVKKHYRFVTVSVHFNVSELGNGMMEPLSAMLDVGCSSDNQWESSVLGSAGTFTRVNPTDSRFAAPVLTRLDCAKCARKNHNQKLLFDMLSHCHGQFSPDS